MAVSLSLESIQNSPLGADGVELAKAALEAGLPLDASEEWRYSPIADLDLDLFSAQLTAPDTSAGEPAECPPGFSARVELINGWTTEIAVSAEASAAGLTVELLEQEIPIKASGGQGTSHNLTGLDGESSLDQLHAALAPATLRIELPPGVKLGDPVAIESFHSGEGVASFPHTEIALGCDSELSVIERHRSGSGAGLTIAHVHLDLEESARLSHSTVQNVGEQHWHLARHVSSVGPDAKLTSTVAAFGGRYSRLRTDIDLAGRGASNELFAVYFGDSDQIHDFRTFQHHSAQDTDSELVFKGVLDDEAGSIYTGMVQIHPDGAGSTANQTNRNVKLSDGAWAWSVPNLEIQNSDVKCSHASAVSPVDADQRFYLHARGVPPVEADKLIVAGFCGEVVDQFPTEVQGELRSLVSSKLEDNTSS